MELLQLRYFVTVAQMLNISHAAKQHMIPQPAMSRTISKLEAELGTQLFDRVKNRLTLTEEGKRFYCAAVRSLSEIDRAVEGLTNPDLPLGGELRILVLQHRATVVDCIMAFKKLYPQVSFRISYEQDMRDYSNYDLCIACVRPDETFDGSICLITEKLKLVVSSQHPAAKQERIGFRQLQEEEFADVSRHSNQWQQTVQQCREAGFEPRMSITCSDLHCLMKYVGAGMAIAVGPEIAWHGLRSSSVVFLETEPELRRSTYVFWNKLKAPSRLIDTYRDFLVEYFQTLARTEAE